MMGLTREIAVPAEGIFKKIPLWIRVWGGIASIFVGGMMVKDYVDDIVGIGDLEARVDRHERILDRVLCFVQDDVIPTFNLNQCLLATAEENDQ